MSNNKRILFFIKLPPPITGATLMNKYVADSKILRSNYDLKIIAVSYNKSRLEMEKKSILKFIKVAGYMYKLFASLLIRRPKVVYFQISPTGIAFYRDMLFISLIKTFRIKILYHLHGKGIKEASKNRINRLLYRYAFRNEDIIFLSKILVNDTEGVYNGKIHIVPNGIPVFNEELDGAHNDNSKIKILFLSNLIISKGILDFIEALSIIKHKKISFEAKIVGAEADLKKKCLLKNKRKRIG